VTTLHVPASVVEQTLTLLCQAGARDCEGVVLWLAPQASPIAVAEAYWPQQIASRVSFRIPPAGLSALLQHVAATGQMVAAQVHSHPGRAFHSRADDEMAVVRHIGALSLVVPGFARPVTVNTFTARTAVFELTADNRWVPVPPAMMQYKLMVA